MAKKKTEKAVKTSQYEGMFLFGSAAATEPQAAETTVRKTSIGSVAGSIAIKVPRADLLRVRAVAICSRRASSWLSSTRRALAVPGGWATDRAVLEGRLGRYCRRSCRFATRRRRRH